MEAENVGPGTSLLKFESWCCVTLSQLLDLSESSVLKALLGEINKVIQMEWPSTWHTERFYKCLLLLSSPAGPNHRQAGPG